MKLTTKITDKNLKTTEWNQIGEKLNDTYNIMAEMSEYEIMKYLDKMDEVEFHTDEYNKLQEELEYKQKAYSIYMGLAYTTFRFNYGKRRSWKMEHELNNLRIDAEEMGLNIY